MLGVLRLQSTLSWVCTVVLCCTIIASQTSAKAEVMMPDAWPWRGVTLSSNERSSPQDIKTLARDLNLNSVQLMMRPRAMTAQKRIGKDEAWHQSIVWANEMLDACKEAGVVAIVSVSQFPVDPSLSLRQDSPEFWSNEKLLAEVVHLSASLAKQLKNRGRELVAYEILSEPLVRSASGVRLPDRWPSLQREIIAAIRENDPLRWIVVTPGIGGVPKGYRDFSPLGIPRLIYGAHMYLPHTYTHQGIHGQARGYTYPGVISGTAWDKAMLARHLSDLRKFQLAYHVPVWIGEFSAVRWAPGSEQYLLDLGGLFDSYGWGWAYFNIGGYHGWNPDYDQEYSEDAPEKWQSHYVGRSSVRWKTLEAIFRKDRLNHVPRTGSVNLSSFPQNFTSQR